MRFQLPVGSRKTDLFAPLNVPTTASSLQDQQPLVRKEKQVKEVVKIDP